MNNSKIVIIIAVIIGIVILVSNQEMISENIIVDELVNESINESGYFQIDRKQYNIGEKIFLNGDYLGKSDKGSILFLRPINDTHRTSYMTIPFDGEKNSKISYFLEPKLNKDKGICSIEDLVGVWSIVFYQTTYENIQFEIKNQISDWDKRTFEPVC